MSNNKRLLSLVTCLLLIASSNQAVSATECSPPKSICAQFWSGDKIFVGRVIRISPYSSKDKEVLRGRVSDSLKPRRIVTLAVEKSFDVSDEKQIEVNVLGSANQNAISFKVGSTYLVFARQHLYSDERRSVEPCNGTRLATEAKDDIAYLESVYKLNPATDLLNYRDSDVVHLRRPPGNTISLPKPPYPELAVVDRAEGPVTVLILIDEGGRVIKVNSLCGHPALKQAAEKAAWKAKFPPTKLSGKAVKASIVINYNFSHSL